MNTLEYKQVAAKMFYHIFGIVVNPSSIILLHKHEEESTFDCIAYLVNDTLIILMKVDKGINIFGSIVDLMYVYAADLAEAIKKENKYHFTKTKLAMLVPKSPFGRISVETYERNRFSEVKAPDDDELKKLNIALEYTLVNLFMDPGVKMDFNKLMGRKII